MNPILFIGWCGLLGLKNTVSILTAFEFNILYRKCQP